MNDFARLPISDPGSAGRASLAVQVEIASRTIPPLWPLDGAIAVNPLAGFEGMPFEDAVREAGDIFCARDSLALPLWRQLCETSRLDRNEVRKVAVEQLYGLERACHFTGPDISLADCLLARLFDLEPQPVTPYPSDPSAELVAGWCAAYFDTGTSVLGMPGRGGGLYPAARGLMPFAAPLKRHWKMLKGAPEQSLPAIGWALDALGIDPEGRPRHLAATVARLPGWAGHIRWRSEHADHEIAGQAPAGMSDLIALVLLCDVALDMLFKTSHLDTTNDVREQLTAHFGVSADRFDDRLQDVLDLDEAALGMIFQTAAERSFGDPLARAVERTAVTPKEAHRTPDAQLVFCIDVRSEPMRRAIEAEGSYETIGYAGFFGLMIAVQPPHRRRVRQLPVLVAPQHDLAMAPVPGAQQDAEDYLEAQRRSDASRSLFSRLKAGAATTFSTAEATGPLAAILMTARTLAPRTMRRVEKKWQGDANALAPALDRQGSCSGLSEAERLAYAKALLALTGMDLKAPLIVFVGHRGEAVNNPYAAALDCGACAGHGGSPNARAMAAIMNDPVVRTQLDIPAHCRFLAGEHNTTTDAIELFDLHLAPDTHSDRIDALRQSLIAAGEAVRDGRGKRLRRPASDLAVGAAHWGEVRPEWGLANNAAFIVAPRALTKDLDLEGRAFLHDYDWRSDPQGEALATILTAPMVVAQWINCQYLFSTLDNERYGAGDKIVHNPTGRIGVVRGNGGDLAVGLPRQSLFHDDGCPAHVPQRLTTIVHAPQSIVEAVIEAQAVLRRLFGNGWVRLIVVDPETGRTERRLTDKEIIDPTRAYGSLSSEEKQL